MKILVTGGAGFIGSHVVRRLLKNAHSITVIDDFNDFYDPSIKRANVASFGGPVEIEEMDLRDWGATQRVFEKVRPEAVIHLAARAGVRPSIADPKLYIDTNITGTFHVLEAARLLGSKKVVFASSSSVYGLSKTVPFREDFPVLQTLSPYAATKIAGELDRVFYMRESLASSPYMVLVSVLIWRSTALQMPSRMGARSSSSAMDPRAATTPTSTISFKG